MNAYTIAVRTKSAYERIRAMAKQLAPRYDANDQLVALDVTDKDPQAEQVKRMEAIADFLERIANAPANAPTQVIVQHQGVSHTVSTKPMMASITTTGSTTGARKGKR